MRVSLHWLKRYVDIAIPADELAHRLTMTGLEVESVDVEGDKFRNFVVGNVLEVRKHPKADKLTLCRVDTGKEVLQIVCGAPNVAGGQKVALGLAGAVVPHNQHDPEGKPFTLARVRVRGEESAGMICSGYELGLSDDREGIMVLDAAAPTGTSLATYLGADDTVFEIGITPNRPDAMNHIGIAREVAMILGTELKVPVVQAPETGPAIGERLSILVEEAVDCPRYTARAVTGVTVGPSPDWMQRLLRSAGLRPVNNIVDVTNFVLMECGQPLHAFDSDRISGGRIIVRRAGHGAAFTTLDGKRRMLGDETLMICDRDGFIAIAGVMGGANSEISESTRNVVIESAYFDPRSIRRTSKFLGLSTDASQRFERGSDPGITVWAAGRAADLIREVGGGEILKGVIDAYPREVKPRIVPIRTVRTNEILGTNLSEAEIVSGLGKLGMDRQPGGDGGISIRVPTFRPDIEREIDLIEEVARVHGYDRIETSGVTSFSLPTEPPDADDAGEVRDWLIGRGFREIVTNSMQRKGTASIASSNVVEIANPISQEMEALRTSLLPGALSVVKHNIFHGTRDLRLFEFGSVYSHDASRPDAGQLGSFVEESMLLMLVSGTSSPLSWDRKPVRLDLFDLKGEVETMFRKILLDKVNLIPYSKAGALTGPGLRIEIQGNEAGYLGPVNGRLLQEYELEQDVFVAELNSDRIFSTMHRERRYAGLPRYPSVRRDLAFVMDGAIAARDVMALIQEAGGSLLRRLEVFDMYHGDQLGVGKKSYGFTLELLADDHTMTQDEIDETVRRIVGRVSSELRATIRT